MHHVAYEFIIVFNDQNFNIAQVYAVLCTLLFF